MSGMPRWRKRGLDVLRTFYYMRFVWDKIANRSKDFDGTARSTFYNDVWRQAARKLSVDLVDLPDGFLEARSGDRMTRMFQNFVMIDHPATIQIAANKPLVHQLLAEHGLPVPPYREFDLQHLGDAREFLESQESPCVVKPAKGTGGGQAVTTNIRTYKDLRRAAIHASLFGHQLMIEKQIPGYSYRLLYLDGELLDAVCRKPPALLSDGTSTIRSLIAAENKRRAGLTGSASLQWIAIDPDCIATLKSQGFSLRSVPPADQEIVVKTVSNDNSERENESVKHLLAPELVREGAEVTRILGIRLCGVDIITTNHAVPLTVSGGVVNEANVPPGFQFHYHIRNRDRMSDIAVPILRRLLDLNGST